MSISNRFNRITLVSNNAVERVTMDFNLGFNGTVMNQNLVIIELKQEKLDRTSKLFQALKQRQVHPYSISKYCMGMATTKPQLKQNYFKHKIITINKKNSLMEDIPKHPIVRRRLLQNDVPIFHEHRLFIFNHKLALLF